MRLRRAVAGGCKQIAVLWARSNGPVPKTKARYLVEGALRVLDSSTPLHDW
jgi:hypothetical protein